MKFLAFLIPILFLSACEEPVFTPKPRGYPKVVYPEKAYQPFSAGYCDFVFEYPQYATIHQDTSFFDQKPEHPCWFNVEVKDFSCSIHCSYGPITQQKNADRLKTDAFKMTDWHNKKATYIEDKPFLNAAKNVKGILFEVEGPVASKLQFFLTDTAEQKHFFRGALYFYTQPNPDSLAPVYEFMKKDVERMLETFEWK